MTDQEKLAAIEAKIARLNAQIHGPDPMLSAFPLGRVGGSGNQKRIANLNASRARGVEKAVAAAVEIQRLEGQAVELRRKIREASPEYQQTQAEKAQRMAKAKARFEEIIRALPIGSPIESQYGTGEIVKHNRKSATVKFALFQEPISYSDLWPSRDQIAAACEQAG